MAYKISFEQSIMNEEINNIEKNKQAISDVLATMQKTSASLAAEMNEPNIKKFDTSFEKYIEELKKLIYVYTDISDNLKNMISEYESTANSYEEDIKNSSGSLEMRWY